MRGERSKSKHGHRAGTEQKSTYEKRPQRGKETGGGRLELQKATKRSDSIRERCSPSPSLLFFLWAGGPASAEARERAGGRGDETKREGRHATRKDGGRETAGGNRITRHQHIRASRAAEPASAPPPQASDNRRAHRIKATPVIGPESARADE